MTLKYSDAARKVNKEVKDNNLKQLIFKNEEVEADDIKGIDVLYRMMVFTFVFSYAKYKFDCQKNNITTEYPNAKRVFDAFSCIYNGEDVGLDLIVYILTEMQIDVINSDKKSYFYNIFNGNDDAIQIPTLRNTIKTWLHSVKLAEKDNAKLLQYFVGLYNALDILKNVELICENNQYAFHFLPTDCIIPNYELFLIGGDDNDFYYLSSYENVENNQSKLNYVSLDGGEVLNIISPTRDFLKKSFTTNHNNAPKSLFAKSFFALGFNYIKNLALAVSDIITKATKQKFYEHFSHKYSEEFEQLGYRNFVNVNWDNVITILMFEEGPSGLLEFVLDSDGIYFDKILHNLEIRYNSVGFTKKIKGNYEKSQSEQMNLVKKYIDDNSSIVKNIITINKTIMAKSIIDGLAELENSKKHSNSQFVESLPMRIKSIDKVINSHESMESKIIKINKALEKTFRYIIPFYYGIIAYQDYKEQALGELDAYKNTSKVHMAPTDDEKNKILLCCEEKFYDAAREKSSTTGKMTLGQLINEFVIFANSLTMTKGRKTTITHEGKVLKDAIGRSYLGSLDTFNSIISLKDASFDDETSEDSNMDILSIINSVKHQKNSYNTINLLTFNRFLLNVKKLFYFLIYNEDYQREMILGQQISYDPIYPYVVRYTERSENRDGYDINSFSVFFSEDAGEKEVKILSERNYEINEKYYCIPNVTTANSRWWIEPFLISCRKFDAIISGNDASLQEGKD